MCKCKNPGCTRLVAQPNDYCDRCRQKPFFSIFPGQQAVKDLRKKHVILHRNRAPSPEPYQHKSKEIIVKKRRHAEYPEPALKKSLKIEHEPREQRFTNIPILFIPFEGNFNNRIVGGFERKGNQTSDIYEEQGEDPYVILGSKQIDDTDMQSSVGSSKHWSSKKGEVTKHKVLAKSSDELISILSKKSISEKEFFELVVSDRLRYLKFSAFSNRDQGLPEVIVLSERLLDWPDCLEVLQKKYVQCFVLDEMNLQDMSAYVLESEVRSYQFQIIRRAGKFSSHNFVEKWLIVKKITVTPAFTVACVHLSSKYTSCTTQKMSPVMWEVIQFARKNGVHAIVGDFNMNTYGLHGGFFPVSNDFVSQGDSDSLSLKTTVATSSGGGDKAYMGGLICESKVCFRSTLTTFGNCAIPPWFSQIAQSFKHKTDFDDRVFSDHHSLYCNYALYDSSQGFISFLPFTSGGGDCFFEALKRQLNTQESLQTLRERVIDGITNDVVHDGRIIAPRSVLVHIPNTDSAYSLQCTTLTAFMAQMRMPGRWVDDSIIPYIAQFLNTPIHIQYAQFYAVFATDGTRQDQLGRAPFDFNVIHMNCRGNHYW